MLRLFIQFLFVICSLSVSSESTFSDTIVIGTVNRMPVTFRELKLCEEKCKANVIQEFKSKYNIPFEAGFWENKSLKPSPADILQKTAFNMAVDLKIQQMLAQKLGMIKDINYKSFHNEWIAENSRRKKAISNHQIIYGPLQFSELNYYDYVLTNLILKLKRTLAKDSFNITENELKTIYELTKEKLYKLPDSVCILKVTVKLAQADTVNSQSLILRKNAEMVRAKLLQNSFSLKGKINPTDKNVLIETETILVSPTRHRLLEGEVYAEILHKTEGLLPAEVSDLFITAKGYEIYKIISKKSMVFKIFETVRNAVFSAETDRQYAEFIHTLKERSIIVQF